jgi:Fe-S-cluster containining protein
LQPLPHIERRCILQRRFHLERPQFYGSRSGRTVTTGARTFTIEIETPDGRLPPAQVDVPDSPLGLSDLAPPIFSLCDGIVGLAVGNTVRSGHTVSCKPGCGVCCRQMVPVSIPEAFYLWHETLLPGCKPPDFFNKNFLTAKSSLERGGLWAKLEECSSGKEQVEAAADYWKLSVDCPYLVNGSCAIHSLRPCACREYNVLSNAEFCARPLDATIKRLTIHRKMTTALAKAAGHILSRPPLLIPLVMVPQWCDQNKELDEMRWAGIQLFELLLYFALKG